MTSPPDSVETERRSLPAPETEELLFPCSLAQERLWIVDRFDRGNSSLNVAVRWQLDGAVSIPLLEQSFRQILDRHEILRTGFVEQDGRPMQRVVASVPFALEVVDLRGVAESSRRAEVERLGREEARKPFRLERPPLIRAKLLRVTETRHLLLVTVHHIVSDGWSIGVLTHEMGAFYRAARTGGDSALPELLLHYGDYALWQAEWLKSDALTAQTDYWAKQLAGLDYFELLTDRPRSAAMEGRGDIASLLLPRTLSDAVEALSRRHGCTFFATALAALATMLHRFTGETDIGLGTQVAGRNEIDLESMIGCFINTLVLRVDLSGDPTYGELMARTSETVLDALAHAEMPIERLIETLKPHREAGRTPLFSINFIVQRSFIRNEDFGDFTITDLPSHSPGPIYDLSFFMVERPEGWRASCEYNVELFERATIETMLACLVSVFADMVTADRKISVARLMNEDECRRQIAFGNDTAVSYPDDMVFPSLFAEQVAYAPSALAVVCGERRMSYAELDRESNRLARYLRHQGVAAGELVGICLERSVEMLVAVLAVMKSGAGYVPLDPAFPAARLAEMIEDAQPVVLLVRGFVPPAHPARTMQIVDLDADAGLIGAERVDPVRVTPSPEDIAYVIYTSGSTGKPKGVQIRHRSLVNFLCAMRREPGLGASDILLAVTTLSFDIAALELFLPLLVGARLIIATREQAGDGRALLRLLQQSRATIMQATPASWQMLIEAGWEGGAALKILCGGEALSRALADQLLAHGELWNLYGPTETTIWSAASRVVPGTGPVPIGLPIANTQFYVLDQAGEPLPAGAIGELCIGGDGVAVGYLDRPELTAERFVPDRLGSSGGPLYRTGDRVRRRASGEIDFLGRFDSQIKLRGFRIELGEIETGLLRHPAVAEAVAIVRGDTAETRELCAYVVARGEWPDLPRMLRAHLGQSLPGYMIPTRWAVLAALPRTPNGKIDRRALPAPSVEASDGNRSASADEIERQLARIWSEVLGAAEIAPDDNFFDLGGHSLLAARMLARVETVFGKSVGLLALFESATLREFAGLLRGGIVPSQTTGPVRSQIYPVQAKGGRRPIIAINNTGIYHTLARQIGTDRPFLAAELLYGESEDPADWKDFPTIAADYVRTLRAEHPRGPYILLGWCTAGNLAYEIAQQLRAVGETVSLLILIDSWAAGHAADLPPTRRRLANLAYRARLVLAEWSRMRRGELRFRDWLARRRIVQRVRFAAGRLAFRLQMTEIPPVETRDPWQVVHLEAAVRRYRPVSYDGPILLLMRDDQPSGAFLDPRFGWSTLATGRFVLKHMSGDHFGIFRGKSAENMARCIIEALGEFDR